MRLNKHFSEVAESYLFSDIAHKVAAYQAAHPEADVIRLGIGDVTLPLAKPVIAALHKAVDEMGGKATFAATAPSRAMISCVRPSRNTMPAEASTSSWRKSSSPTAPRATWATCWTCSP